MDADQKSKLASMDSSMAQVMRDITAQRDCFKMHASLQDMHTRAVQFLAQRQAAAAQTLADGLLALSKQQAATKAQAAVDSARKSLCESLVFPDMFVRQESISPAHRKTFNWIFDENSSPNSQSMKWNSFVQWLRSENGIYWIKGKAGSGKSTLMSYILADYRTDAALSHWAHEMPWTQASFFFWALGSDMQKSLTDLPRSQAGLLRSILYQCFSMRADLIEPVLGTQALSSRRMIWSVQALCNAFERLMEQMSTGMKLCLFIDGLDEFDGDPQILVDLFVQATRHSNIKICLSSRPLLIFEQAFQAMPQLKLHDLTENDMKQYIQDKLYSHEDVLKLDDKEFWELSALVSAVEKQAQGVFLWAKLVLKSLQNGLWNGDTMAILNKRLMKMPTELDHLFQDMLMDLEPYYLEKASQLFDFMAVSSRPPLLLTLTLADSMSVDEVFPHEIQEVPGSHLASNLRQYSKRILSHGVGLLTIDELSGEQDPFHSQDGLTRIKSLDHRDVCKLYSTRVSYLHLTVRDFWQKSGADLHSKSADSKFDPVERLMGALVLLAKTSPPVNGIALRLATEMIHYARCPSRSNISGRAAMLQEFDRVMTQRSDYFNLQFARGKHWSNVFFQDGREAKRGEYVPNENLLDFCAFYFLPDYLEYFLDLDTAASQQENLDQLLRHAVKSCDDIGHMYTTKPVPEPRLIEILLKRGANPNAQVNQCLSPWQQLLEGVGWGSWRLTTDFVDILRLLLENGADIDNKLPRPFWEGGEQKWHRLSLAAVTQMSEIRIQWGGGLAALKGLIEEYGGVYYDEPWTEPIESDDDIRFRPPLPSSKSP